MVSKVNIIGGGLAGSAAALELAARGVSVTLYEMRPDRMTPAHTTGELAELVCSNSMGSSSTFTANGLMMEELKLLKCRLLEIAFENSVPAGQALAVDRIRFSKAVTQRINNETLIELIHDEITDIPSDSYVILASGPLTSESLSRSLADLIGDNGLFFFDATSPSLSLSSVDMSRAFWGNRRDTDGRDYLNCPLTREEFSEFHNALISAERVDIKDFEPDKLFESCLPVEIIASRGYDALRFGALKPVGLRNPETNESHYAVVQLRREDVNGEFLNMVGFQTRLKYSEQKRVFRMIPALRNAEFVRFGHMHRNFYINAPNHLDKILRLKTAPNIFLAGQITGGEGYLEAVSQGTFAGINLARIIAGDCPVEFPAETLMGSYPSALVNFEDDNFQPMKVNFGMLPPPENRIHGKRNKRQYLAERSIKVLRDFVNENGI